jgi:hypothetical protein
VWQSYLVLRGLRLYYSESEYAMEVYKEIRSRIIMTVESEFERSHQTYEYYDDRTGKGLGRANFGWTALIAPIVDEVFI